MSPNFDVSDAAKAIKIYHHSVGATELSRIINPQSGKVGHAERMLNGHLIMLPDEYLAHNKTPQTLGGTTVKLGLMPDDVDAAKADRRWANAYASSRSTEVPADFLSALDKHEKAGPSLIR